MAIRLENVGIAVRDLESAIAFFVDLGLTLAGQATVQGDWADTAVGLDGNHVRIAMLHTPDGHGRIELFEYIHPDAIETEPTPRCRDLRGSLPADVRTRSERDHRHARAGTHPRAVAPG